MYGSRETNIVRLIQSRIEAGKELTNSKSHIKIVNVGEFYYVQHWNTKIAVGVRTEPPFAMTTKGWNTKTTINYLRALGFDLKNKRISLRKYRNPKTHRMVNDFRNVLHIDDHPMLDESGEPDYFAWYGHNGVRVSGDFF